MPRKDALKAEGLIVQAMPQNVFRVELANGHRLVAHLPGRLRHRAAELALGCKVQLELTPYDLSRARIRLEEP